MGRNTTTLKLRLQDAALVLRDGELTLTAHIPDGDTPVPEDLAVLSGMMIAFGDESFRRLMVSMLAREMESDGLPAGVH